MRLILVAAVPLLLVAATCPQAPSFKGTELTASEAAPPFQLHDHFGNPVSLSELADNVVVLTFLYTTCPDICPVITSTLRRVYDRLGDDTDRVKLVAITVDPARDSTEQVHRYSQEKGMLHKWSYLVGNEAELAPVWAAYYVAAQRDAQGSKGVPDQLASQSASSALKDEHDHGSDAESIQYLVTHTSAVYLIDREGRLRVLFTDLTLDAEPLVHDIRLLL